MRTRLPTQAEDWDGRLWWVQRAGYRSRLCTDSECIVMVVLERRGLAEWWWLHGDVSEGPFGEWREAARGAAAAGVVA